MRISRSTCGVLMCAIAFLLCTGAQSAAQSKSAVVIQDAPIMLLPDAKRTPLHVVPVGTRLVSLGVEGQWMRVEFDDSRYGRRSGYIETRFVRIDAPPPAPPPAPREQPTAGTVAPAPEPRPVTPTAPKSPAPAAPVAEAPRAAAPAVPVSAADHLTDAEIHAAIAEGQKGEPKPIGCFADVRFAEALGSDFSRGYTAIVSGPHTRLASAAAEAKRKYLPFTRADVTDALSLKVLTVAIHPQAPEFASRRWQRAAPATHVVIRPKVEDRNPPPPAIQPTRVDPFPVSWNNAFGMKFDGQGVVAMFNVAQIPSGVDLDVIVITDIGERDCTIRKGDWARVR